MAQNLLSGKTGYLNDSTANRSFGKWDLELITKLIPVPNFNGGGYMQKVTGLYDGKFTLTGPYDQGNMPYTVGNQYTFNFGLAPSVFLTAPGIIGSIKMSEDVENNPAVTITGETNGAFSISIT